jgi:hypothetical protein
MQWKRDLTPLFSGNPKPQRERDCINVPHHILRNIKELTHFLEGWETGEISPEGGILRTRAHKLKKTAKSTIRLDSRGGPHKRALAGDWRTPTPLGSPLISQGDSSLAGAYPQGIARN